MASRRCFQASPRPAGETGSGSTRGAGWGVGAASVERSSGPAPEEPPEPVLAGGATRSLCSPEMPPAPVWI